MHSWGFLDKGAKLAVGLVHAKRFHPTHVMFVDADDFVSRRLAAHVAANPAAPGWYVDEGLFYSKQFKIAEPLEKFWSLCGTSHILRADLLPVDLDVVAAVSPPAVANVLGQFYVERVLGCHLDFQPHVAKMGLELSPLPFNGAVWQADTGENSSRTWWKYTRFGPVWGKALSPEESLDFTIPIEQRKALDTALLLGWRTRSLLTKSVSGARRLRGLLRARSTPADRRA
jgi:hypothetical protein